MLARNGAFHLYGPLNHAMYKILSLLALFIIVQQDSYLY
jgi:hypothetical protein